MIIAYNLLILLTRVLIRIVGLFNPKMKLWHKGQSDWYKKLSEGFEPSDRNIWVHAASLGEFEQGRPLIERIRKAYPDHKIVLTFFSPSGYEVRKAYEGADYVCYLPLDSARSARKFIEAVQPSYVFFIKYEYWHHYLQTLRKKDIPTYLVSGIFRPKHIFFQWYGGFFRNMLGCFTHFFVQDKASVDLLKGLGFENSTIVGDTRFDRVNDITTAVSSISVAEAFKGARLLYVTGSSWPADEDLICNYINTNKRTDIVYAFAPHEIHESHLTQIESKLGKGLKVVRYSQATPENVVGADVLIIDNFGLLSSLYAYGDFAHIGGGFGSGIHNTLEAATFGMPISFGPNYSRFKEAVELVELGAGTVVTDFDSYKKQLDVLVEDAAFRLEVSRKSADYVAHNCGACEKVLDAVFV